MCMCCVKSNLWWKCFITFHEGNFDKQFVSKKFRPPKSQNSPKAKNFKTTQGGKKKLKEQKLQDHPGAIQLEKTKISQSTRPPKSKNKSKNPHFASSIGTLLLFFLCKHTLKKMSVLDIFCVNTLLKKNQLHLVRKKN